MYTHVHHTFWRTLNGQNREIGYLKPFVWWLCFVSVLCCCILCSHISEWFGQFQFNIWSFNLIVNKFLFQFSLLQMMYIERLYFILRRYSSSLLFHCQAEIHANWAAFVPRNWVIYFNCTAVFYLSWMSESRGQMYWAQYLLLYTFLPICLFMRKAEIS